jgi:predicted nucleic acid-binding protein
MKLGNREGDVAGMASRFLVDTSVLSEARKSSEKLDRNIVFFLRQLPPEALAIPLPAVFELQRGALKKQRTDPAKGRAYARWLDRLLATDVWVPRVNTDVKKLVAEMAATPELERYWLSRGDPPRIQFGCDPEIAAISIIYDIPIASTNVRDFLHINQHFPVPGLYTPMGGGKWHLPPPDGWQLGDHFQADLPDWRSLIGPLV